MGYGTHQSVLQRFHPIKLDVGAVCLAIAIQASTDEQQRRFRWKLTATVTNIRRAPLHTYDINPYSRWEFPCTKNAGSGTPIFHQIKKIVHAVLDHVVPVRRPMKTAAKKADHSKTEHITEKRVLSYIFGQMELSDDEEEHIRNCQYCDETFRMLLIANDRGFVA